MPCPRFLVALAALALVLSASSTQAEMRVTVGGVHAVAWLPPDARPAPVVVFSHGLGMCPTQARFLTTALAEAGYVVVAPYHADSACDLAFGAFDAGRVPLKPAHLWSDADYRDRADDVVRLLAALPGDAVLGSRAAPSRVALVGHSLGGYTVLGLAGAWPSWPAPPGVAAVVAMSPYTLPLLANGALDALRVPVMFQAGTQDPVFTLPVRHGKGAYARAPAPKLLVEIDYGTHFAWTDAGMLGRAPIVSTTLAFLDHHLRGLPEAAPLLAAGDGVASLQREPPAAQPVPLGAGPPASFGAPAWSTMRDWWQRIVSDRPRWPF